VEYLFVVGAVGLLWYAVAVVLRRRKRQKWASIFSQELRSLLQEADPDIAKAMTDVQVNKMIVGMEPIGKKLVEATNAIIKMERSWFGRSETAINIMRQQEHQLGRLLIEECAKHFPKEEARPLDESELHELDALLGKAMAKANLIFASGFF
jgi:hypothetical protein